MTSILISVIGAFCLGFWLRDKLEEIQNGNK